MSKFDVQYLKLCKKILTKGEKEENRTGVVAYKLPLQYLKFDLEKEFPILTTKEVLYKIAFLEMMWIYLAKSNDVRWLNERGSKLWNYWAVEPDGYYRIYGD